MTDIDETMDGEIKSSNVPVNKRLIIWRCFNGLMALFFVVAAGLQVSLRTT